VKKGLTVEDQIKYLEKHKNIIFKDDHERKSAKEYLLKYSYSDVINPLKVLFSSGYDDDEDKKCHKYEYKTKWSEIKRLHEQSRKIEQKVVQEILDFEQNIKSFFCDWLSREINEGTYDDFKNFINKLEMNQEEKIKLKRRYELNFYKNYNKKGGYPDKNYENYWWLLIMSLSFGEFKRLMEYKILKNNETKKVVVFISEDLSQREESEDITKILETLRLNNLNLDTINVLRNALCHKTNILIFLDQPLRNENEHTYTERKKTLKHFMKKAHLDEPKEESQKIITFYKEIKNRRRDDSFELNLI
jgi:hypothetical protein